ncbi:MAG: hypothetical protein LBQ41_00640 [Candidatus Ancillula sp.]|jgi:hypothetical protein|nr:hypothetical protein [Candidatus Ancillula sp.]
MSGALINKKLGITSMNVRTQGEFAKFVSNVYKIKTSPDERSALHWATLSSISAAFDASPTLNSFPNIRYDYFSCGNHIKMEILGRDCRPDRDEVNGDFLTWTLIHTFDKNGINVLKPEFQRFFKQVNYELQEAFDTGKLQQGGRFFLTPSMGGKTLEEVIGTAEVVPEQVLALTTYNFPDSLTYFGGIYYDTVDYQNSLRRSNMPFTAPYEGDTVVALKIITHIFNLYKILGPLFVLLWILGIIRQLAFLIRYREKRTTTNSLFVITLITLPIMGCLILFAISWFCYSFIGGSVFHNFYELPAVPFFLLPQAFGLAAFFGNSDILDSLSSKLQALYRNSRVENVLQSHWTKTPRVAP